MTTTPTLNNNHQARYVNLPNLLNTYQFIRRLNRQQLVKLRQNRKEEKRAFTMRVVLSFYIGTGLPNVKKYGEIEDTQT